MEKYIKVNAKVAKFLHLDTIRNAVKDGNYLLWMMDIQDLGSPADLSQTIAQIGGLLLTGAEAREEQDGVVNRNLPVPTDKRFILDSEDSNSDTSEQDGDDNSENGNSGSSSSESEEDTPDNGDSKDSTGSPDSDEPDLKQEGGNNE